MVRATIRTLVIAAVSLMTPTAVAQGLAGTFDGTIDGGPLHLVLAVDGSSLTGTLSGAGVHFRLQGQVTADGGFGVVETGNGTASFEAYVDGDTLGLYLFEVDAAGQPVMASVIELILTRRGASAPAASGPPGDETLATGAYATLTRDDAEAFIEALEFVLAQIGYPYTFPDAERAEVLRTLAANFPYAAQTDQLVLADARAIWERVLSNWEAASDDDRREFALGVLVLAFGEQTVASWVDDSSGAAAATGGGTCASFEDCTASFVDDSTWSDTFNTQGCWAAAGCSGFDASTNSFDYSDQY